MRIAFAYSKGRPANWVNRAFGGTALGGSEASMVHYAMAFAKLGHEVTIFTPGAPSRELGGVKWHNFKGIHGMEFDVAIALRFPQALPSILAPLKALYCCDPEIPELPEFVGAGQVHLVITISQHQKERFQAQHPIPGSLYMVSNAGINYSDYEGKDVEKVRGRCIYCSVLARGLLHLAHIWPLIHKQVPWATLHVTGGFELWGMDVPIDEQPALQMLMTLEGVAYLGVLSREALIREQLESEVLLLPGATDSPEMCCISALECAAAGNLLVVGAVGALPERVWAYGSGKAVAFEGDKPHTATFVHCAEEMLTYPPSVRAARARHASESVRQYDYAVLAPQWIARFEEALNG